MAGLQLDIHLLQGPRGPQNHRVLCVAGLHGPPPVPVHAGDGAPAHGRDVPLAALRQAHAAVVRYQALRRVPEPPGGAGVLRGQPAVRFQTAGRLRFPAHRPNHRCRLHALLGKHDLRLHVPGRQHRAGRRGLRFGRADVRDGGAVVVHVLRDGEASGSGRVHGGVHLCHVRSQFCDAVHEVQRSISLSLYLQHHALFEQPPSGGGCTAVLSGQPADKRSDTESCVVWSSGSQALRHRI